MRMAPRAGMMPLSRGPALTLAAVVVASLLMAGSALLAADAYRAASLYEQVRDGEDGQILYCGNPDHLLVLRANLKLACVYPETAAKKSWHPVTFDGNGRVTVSDSVLVGDPDKGHVISYSITGGLLDSVLYDPDSSSLLLEIRTVGDGGGGGGGGDVMMSVPKKVFLQGGGFVVLEDGQEVEFASLQDDHYYLLQFNFTHADPVIEVLRTYLLCHPFCS